MVHFQLTEQIVISQYHDYAFHEPTHRSFISVYLRSALGRVGTIRFKNTREIDDRFIDMNPQAFRLHRGVPETGDPIRNVECFL